MAAVVLIGTLSAGTGAVEVSNLYTARVQWSPDDPAGRDRAYELALRGVLIRATGSRDADRDPTLLSLFDDPEKLVLGFRSAANDTIWVSFDGGAINDRLQAANKPVWASDRPLSLVWLAVDRGRRGRSILASSDSAAADSSGRSAEPNEYLRERLELAAQRRGIPLALPLVDARDREALEFADVWGGFDERILDASRRYNAMSILVGRLNTTAGQSSIRWIWHFAGDRREITGSVEQTVDQVANSMAQRFAIVGTAERMTLALEVSGVNTVEIYGALLRFLRSLPQVKAADVTLLAGDTIQFQISAIGTHEQFMRGLESNRRLIAESSSERVEPKRRPPNFPAEAPDDGQVDSQPYLLHPVYRFRYQP